MPEGEQQKYGLKTNVDAFHWEENMLLYLVIANTLDMVTARFRDHIFIIAESGGYLLAIF